MNRFHVIARLSQNREFKQICYLLALYAPGDRIDEDEVATLTGLHRDTVILMLDTLAEIGALLPNPPGALKAA